MGRRGPVPMPKALKKRRGTYRPSRAAKDAMELPVETPDVPEWLDDEGRKEWARVVPMLEEAKVLSAIDRVALGNYCAAVSLAIKATREYQKYGVALTKNKRVYTHPMIKVAQEARAQALRIGAEFGLTPASRTRVSGKAAKTGHEGDGGKKDDAEKFLFDGAPKLEVVK